MDSTNQAGRKRIAAAAGARELPSVRHSHKAMIQSLFIFGTRPEAIKLGPVIRHMKSRPSDFVVRVCVTAQHREMLDQVLHPFDVTPDQDLDIMRPGQTLSESTSRIVGALEPILSQEKPDIVLVQGDTTTTFCGALAAFYAKVPVGHVEAGLRTGDPRQPFPEEMNRVLTSRLTAWHFAPTAHAAEALRREGVSSDKVFVTGNTGIDAVLRVRDGLDRNTLSVPAWPWLDPKKRLILVTSHRRENFGPGFDSAMQALAILASRPDVQIVYPVHRNPNVQGPAHRILSEKPNI